MAIDLVIVTPEGEAYSGSVEQVVLPGSEGDFGVLQEHERTLAPLQHGPIEIKTAGGSLWAAVSKGFAEVSAERVVVLADSCVLAKNVDKAAVEAELSDAQSEIESLPDTEENAAQRESLSEVIRQCEVRLEVAAK